MMATCVALPRYGHLNGVYRIFGYLKSHHNAEMVFDPSHPDIDEDEFPDKDWSTSEFGSDLKEILPDNMPEPRGQGMIMRCFVDADHASDSITRRSRIGFIIYLNTAPIYWYSKKQTTVETKQCTEYVRGLRYRMRMMGIPVLGPTYIPTYIYGDNQSVLYKTTIPE